MQYFKTNKFISYFSITLRDCILFQRWVEGKYVFSTLDFDVLACQNQPSISPTNRRHAKKTSLFARTI
jgi:hypothetical protein